MTLGLFFVFDIVDFDTTLSMDWLSPNHATLDYFLKIVTLAIRSIYLIIC